MARVFEPTDEQERAYVAWAASRPPVVRAIAERLRPWELYRMASTGQRVTIASISEDGTVTVRVSGEHNLIDFAREVFGVDPDTLTPCDLPGPDVPVGEMVAPEEQSAYIEAMRREIIRKRQGGRPH